MSVLGRSVLVGSMAASEEGIRGANSCNDGRSERRTRECCSDGIRPAGDRSRGGIAPKE